MWYYIDFRIIDHAADDAGVKSPLETTMIFAESKEEAIANFLKGMEGEPHTIISVQT